MFSLVAGTQRGRHTLAPLVQEGPLRADTAVHLGGADLAGGVRLAQSPAGTTAAAGLVAVDHAIRTVH